MTHNFHVGDIVRLNGTDHQAEIIRVDPRHTDVVLCKWTDLPDDMGNAVEVNLAVKSLTLVRAASGETTLPNNPRIETSA